MVRFGGEWREAGGVGDAGVARTSPGRSQQQIESQIYIVAGPPPADVITASFT